MANAVKTYNGGNAFLLKPNGMDSRTVNKYLYTPSQIPQQGILANYDPAHPDSYSGTGTTLFDLTANNNDITLYGGFESGYAQNGWFVNDAVNDYGASGNVTLNGTSFTLGIWVRRDDNFNPPAWPFLCLDATTGYGLSLTIRTDANGDYYFRWRFTDSANVGRNQNSTTSPVSLGTWYYAVATLDTTTDTMYSYYFDGTGLVQTLTRTDNTADFGTNTVVGPINYGGVPLQEKGVSVGEAHIYQGSALIQGRIENIYNNTKARYGY